MSVVARSSRIGFASGARQAAALASLAVIAACAAPDAPSLRRIETPGVTACEFGVALLADQFATEAATEPAVASAPLPVRVRTALLDRRPDGGAPLVDALAATFAWSASGGVALPSAEAREGRFWQDEAARATWADLATGGPARFCALDEGWLPVLDGLRQTLTAGWTETIEARDDFLRERSPAERRHCEVGVEVERRGGTVQVALVRGTRDRDGERLRLAPLLDKDAASLLAVIPSPFRESNGRWCALLIERRAPESLDAEEQEALASRISDVAAMRAEMRAEWTALRAQRREPEGGDVPVVVAPIAPRGSRLVAAWQKLPGDASGRRGLVWITAHWPESFVAALALVADDAALGEFLVAQAASRATQPPPGEDDVLIATLERAAYGFAAKHAADETLAPELQAVLSSCVGAVAVFPSTLEALAKQEGPLAAIEARVRAENRLALEESSAALRVRAFDWLAARGAAPAGFDPLASAAERRKALRAAESAASSATSAKERGDE